MSREQANTFKKYRDADDAMGNLGWAAKMAKRAVRQAPEAPDDILTSFGFSEKEQVLWMLLQIARRYSDLENAGILDPERARGFLRGLVAADVLDLLEVAEGRALVPLEVKRMRAKLKGESGDAGQSAKRKSIQDRVFRPDIGLHDDAKPNGSDAAAAPPSAAARPAAPAPVDLGGDPKAAPEVLGAKDWEIKKKLVKAFDAMKDQNHYGFLGVKQNCSEAAIKEAGLKLAREYHPDVLSGTVLADDQAIVRKLDALFKRLQDARSTLGNPRKRTEYDGQLNAGTNRSEGKKVRRPAEAKIAFQKAETFFKKKEYENAEQHYRVAVELDFDDPKIQTALAWCILFNEKRDKTKRTDKAYRKLVGILDKYKLAEAAYRLGMMARMDGKESDAMKRFKEATRIDPAHQAAAQEVRISDRRTNKAKDDEKAKGGMFGKFLKR